MTALDHKQATQRRLPYVGFSPDSRRHGSGEHFSKVPHAD
jgi:hypothetical protein